MGWSGMLWALTGFADGRVEATYFFTYNIIIHEIRRKVKFFPVMKNCFVGGVHFLISWVKKTRPALSVRIFYDFYQKYPGGS